MLVRLNARSPSVATRPNGPGASRRVRAAGPGRVRVTAEIHHRLQDRLAVAREEPDFEVEHAQLVGLDAEFGGRRGDLVTQDVLRPTVGDGGLAGGERDVVDVMPFVGPARDGSACAKLAVVGVRREHQDGLVGGRGRHQFSPVRASSRRSLLLRSGREPLRWPHQPARRS